MKRGVDSGASFLLLLSQCLSAFSCILFFTFQMAGSCVLLSYGFDDLVPTSSVIVLQRKFTHPRTCILCRKDVPILPKSFKRKDMKRKARNCRGPLRFFDLQGS